MIFILTESGYDYTENIYVHSDLDQVMNRAKKEMDKNPNYKFSVAHFYRPEERLFCSWNSEFGLWYEIEKWNIDEV